MSKTTLAAQGNLFYSWDKAFLFTLNWSCWEECSRQACVFLSEGFKHLHVPLFAQQLDHSQVICDTVEKICRRLVFVFCAANVQTQG